MPAFCSILRRAKSRYSLILLSGVMLALCTGVLARLLAADPPSEREAPQPLANTTSALAPAEFSTALHNRAIPLFEAHCLDCHTGPGSSSGIALDPLLGAEDINEHRGQWERVLQMVRSGAMPPQDGTPLEDADRHWLTDTLERSLEWCDCSGPRDPGRVTLRRMNRAEYRNTIRDLIGIDYEPADDFPVDGVGYGFDNIGDVLSLPPLLLEKYLSAAEGITDQAIVIDPPKPLALRLAGADMQGDPDGTFPRGSGKVLYRGGSVYTEVDMPSDGSYEIVIGAYGDQAGDDPAEMSLLVDDDDLAQFVVPEVRRAPGTYTWTMQLPAGTHRIELEFTNDFYLPPEEEGGKAKADRNLAVEFLAVNGPLEFEPVPLPESHERIFFVMPDGDITVEAAAEQILTRFASRAFRRPVTEGEMQRLMRLFQQSHWRGDTFESSIQLAATAILVSPNFLFLVESDPEDAPPLRDLTEFELATRLSYFLWSSLPDDELYELAEQGQLREPGVLAAQVERMLADPKAWAFTENFAGQWLHLRLIARSQPDPEMFPTFSEELRADMTRETLLCFEYLVQDDRSIFELLSADYTFLNERLAQHYGIEGISGNDFRKVALANTPRGGVLTQASVLTATSNPTRTSAVKRGRWVMEVLLGTPPPPPPPDAPSLPQAPVDAPTLREQLEQHRADPRCAVCHETMDPLGFALENFDAVGAWREEDSGHPIDSVGELPDGSSFAGPVELRELLLNDRSDDFARTMTQNMLTYSLGRGLEHYDRCTVNDIMEELAAGDYRLHTLVQAIVASDAFQKRRTTP